MFEKKRGKRFLASVMALVMLLSLAPIGTLAAGNGDSQENTAVSLPANGDDQKPVVTDEENTANTNEEPTPPPRNEGIATLPANNNNTPVALPETPVIVKPAEGLIDEALGVDADTSDSDNDIAEYWGGNGGPGGNQGKPVEQPEAVTSITAEYWVTNSKVTATGKTSMTISKDDSEVATKDGISIESLAPAEGTNVGGTAIFWQARVLPSDKHQTEGGGIDRTGDGQKIQKIKYNDSNFQYQIENNDEWTDFSTDDQLVFYYLIKTDFAENIQINVSDWPALKEPKKSDNRDHYNNYRKVTYQVYRMDENDIAESNPCDSKDTWYYSGVKISAVQVSKNELESCSIDRIEVSHTDTLKNGENPSVDSSSNADFRIDLSKVPAHTNVVVKIYVKVNKYLVIYKSDGNVFHREAYKATTEVNQLTRIPEKEGFTFKGWTSEDVTVSNNKFTMPAKDVVFTAVWEEKETPVTPTEPTKVVDAKYFVLLPGRGTPASGVDQGTSYYLPNKTNNGGITGLTYLTGYTGGGLTAAGKTAADNNYTNSDSTNGVFDRAGIDASYLVVPTDLGYFTVGNWTAEGVYSPTSTPKANLSNVLGENFNTNSISITWYSLKKQFRDGKVIYHVDGYVKDIPVTLTYHDNFTGSNDSYKQTGLKSGDEITIAPSSKVNNETTFSHDGYVFAGWYDNAAGSGTNYAGQTHTMMDNLELYAKWTPKQYTYTVEYYYDGAKNDSKTENGSAAFGSQVTNYADKNITGYKFAKVEGLPLEISANAADNVIKVYYVKDDSQKKKLQYTVEYYKDDEKVSGDTQVVKEEVWVNAPDTLTVNKAEIAPADKYTGCMFEKTDPATIPDTINNNGVIKVYYTKTENPPEEAQYTVKHYKWDTQKKEYTLADTDVIDSTVGAEVTATAKKYDDGYILNEQKSKQTKSGTVFEGNTLTLKLYYDVDKIGKGENLDQPDGTIDRYQVTIIYKSSDESKGTVSTKKEVLTIKKADNEKILLEDAMIKGSKATDNGGRNYFSNWTDEVNNKTINDATLTADTIKTAIETAEGGETYTFTANFGYSSGGGSGGSNRPKPPVVEIPDDVPTGLNGKDHYAYIIGYGNNDVRPQNNITRAEVATIFFRLLTDETREANMTKSNSYNDMKDGDWFCCAVSTLSKMGIIKGYEDGSFKPNDPISRAEFAAIAARFDPDGDKTPATFADVTSHWAKDEISIAANHGWIKGYEDGSFKPDQKITRAETMTLVNRVLNRLPETKDDLHKDMKTWVDNMDETAWYYLAVQEATNSHYFKNKTSTKFEQWTDLRDTRDWSELEK